MGAKYPGVTEQVKSAVPDFDLRFLNFHDLKYKTEEDGYGRGLHNDPDPSPEGARRINVIFVRDGPLEVTMLEFSPAMKARVIAGAGRVALLHLHSWHAALYNQGLVDIDWFSAFALRGTLETGDGLVFADVNAHDFKHTSFPRRSTACLFEATPKKRYRA